MFKMLIRKTALVKLQNYTTLGKSFNINIYYTNY